MPAKRKNNAKAKRKVAETAPSSSSLSGKTFCLSGALSLSRNDMTAKLVLNGANVAKTVTAEVTHLLIPPGQHGTAKCIAAKKKGIEIVTEEELLQMLTQPASNPQKKAKIQNPSSSEAGMKTHFFIII